LLLCACSPQPEGPKAGPQAEIDPLFLKDALTSQNLLRVDFLGSLLPAGVVILEIEEEQPARVEISRGALYTIKWSLDSGSGTRSAIFYTVYPSASASWDAWRLKDSHPIASFNVQSATTLESFGYPARLLSGSVGPPEEYTGFSDAFALRGNVYIRVNTTSGLTGVGGNAHLAVELLRHVAGIIGPGCCMYW
jgi:hypothetical protein